MLFKGHLQVPDDQRLITGSRQKNIGVAAGGSEGGDPTEEKQISK
jgi:hypothetical protein